MTLEVRHLEQSMYQAWDAYVGKHELGSFYHLSGWLEVISRTYSHHCYFLYVIEQDDNSIVAILPLVHVKSKLFGNTLVSTPFCIQGGVLTDTQAASEVLLDYSKELAHQLNVDYIEFRSDVLPYQIQEFSKPKEDISVTFGCDLAGTSELILANIKKKQRAVIRQSLKNGLSYQIESNVDNLYRIYSYSVRNLGTPVFSKLLFENLLQVFPNQCEVLTVFHGNCAVSSVMSFYYKEKVIPHYGGGLFDARALKSNDYMYYQLMCHSKEQGAQYFDFGRSKIGSGAYQYKKHWGMTPIPANSHYFLNVATSPPALNVTNPKYALAIKLWKKLPLKLSQVIGPQLSKYLG